MKKMYQKPELFFENFSLMEAITACKVTAQQGDPSQCSWYDAEGFGVNIFTADTVMTCDYFMDPFEVGTEFVFGS